MCSLAGPVKNKEAGFLRRCFFPRRLSSAPALALLEGPAVFLHCHLLGAVPQGAEMPPAPCGGENKYDSCVSLD